MMATGADDAAALAALWKWGLAILGAIGTGAFAAVKWMLGRIVKKHDEEIASINSKLTKVEGQVTAINQKLPEDYTPLERFEDYEERTRQSIIALHGKIEGSEQRLAAKIDGGHQQIVNLLLQQRK
jgi:hypothetical protein